MFISRKASEVLASAVCLAAIIGAIIGIDPRVRERFWELVSTASAGDVPFAGQIHGVGRAILRVAQDHSLAQAPLLAFAAVALILVMFMLRT